MAESSYKPTQFTPPVYLLASLLLMFVFHRLLPAVRLWGFPWSSIAVVPILVGFALAMYCAWLFHKRKTTIKPFEESAVLVTEGPFRLSRNPMYASMVLMLIGVAIGLGTLTPWFIVPGYIYVMRKEFIASEEARLRTRFGDQYDRYCRRVRRWF